MIKEKTKNEVTSDHIIEMISNHFCLEFNSLTDSLDKPLTKRPNQLNGIELYQLLMLIEKEYKIYFKPDDIKHYGFNSINNIINLVNMYL